MDVQPQDDPFAFTFQFQCVAQTEMHFLTEQLGEDHPASLIKRD